MARSDGATSDVEGLDPRSLPKPRPLPTNRTRTETPPPVPPVDPYPSDDADKGGVAKGLVIGLVVGALLLGAGLAAMVAYALGQDDEPVSVDPPPTLLPEATAIPTPAPVERTQTPPVTDDPVATAADAEPDLDFRDDEATEATPGGTADQGQEPPPESVGYVRNGQIFLEGAVPDQESADAIVELANSILGPDNVINNYIIDPRAGDPGSGKVIVEDAVLFETGSSVISAEFEPLLNQGFALLSIVPQATMTVYGHTDSVGSKDLNQILSEERAAAVVTFWTDRGVDPDRLTAVGLGESNPRDSNETEAGRNANRRIEVTIDNLLSGT